MSAAKGDAAVTASARRVKERLFGDLTGRVGETERLRFRLALLGRQTDRLRYLVTMPLVERMLAMAEVKPDDVVYDLGCGDGRIVIEAAKHYGAKGLGVDMDPERVAESRANAKAAGVEEQVKFIESDVMDVDLKPASVIMVWLLPGQHLKLRSKLERELKPGTPVVGHSFDMGDWIPEKTEIVEVSAWGQESQIAYMWRVGQGASRIS
jgi:SAM-dependent methyltransferase